MESSNVGILRKVFSEKVITIEACATDCSSSLHPGEASYLSQTTSYKRRSQFSTGRLCARLALERLGVSGVPVLRGVDGEPQWPIGIVGSITHTENYVGVALGHKKDVGSIGADVELIGSVTQDTWKSIFVARERNYLIALPSAQNRILASVMFSAKEAYYKWQFSLYKRWVNFDEVFIDIAGNQFAVVATQNGDRLSSGSFVVSEPLVCTGIEGPAMMLAKKVSP